MGPNLIRKCKCVFIPPIAGFVICLGVLIRLHSSVTQRIKNKKPTPQIKTIREKTRYHPFRLVSSGEEFERSGHVYVKEMPALFFPVLSVPWEISIPHLWNLSGLCRSPSLYSLFSQPSSLPLGVLLGSSMILKGKPQVLKTSSPKMFADAPVSSLGLEISLLSFVC